MLYNGVCFYKDAGSVIFNGMVLAKIGGNLNERNQIIDYFNGIISSN